MKKLVFILSCLAGAIRGLSADTNIIYLPVDPRIAIGKAAKAMVYQEQLEAAKHLPECRPAELDPEGHWGNITAGLQLGVRFSTNTFQPGQPIDIVILLRNTTTNPIAVPFVGNASMDLIVHKDANQPIQPTNRALWLSSSGPLRLGLPPRNQMKYSYRLDDIFDMSTPGAYHVFAKCGKFKPSMDWPEIKSGTAEITVVERAAK